MVGQLAKLYGARAVGIAGGPDKCAFVKGELGFDSVVDHRSENFVSDLTAASPNGLMSISRMSEDASGMRYCPFSTSSAAFPFAASFLNITAQARRRQTVFRQRCRRS